MPKPGMRWRHVVISTYASWLPGDPRGWRSKRHKRHSSGDYKAPPPPGEHQGLHRYSKRVGGEPVLIPRDLRAVVGHAIVNNLQEWGCQVLAVSVGGMHAHLQVELPDNLKEIRHIVGQCKSASSHAIRERLPGRVWARDGKYKPINDERHQRQVFQYILDQENAWTRSYKDAKPRGERSEPRGSNPRPT